MCCNMPLFILQKAAYQSLFGVCCRFVIYAFRPVCPVSLIENTLKTYGFNSLASIASDNSFNYSNYLKKLL